MNERKEIIVIAAGGTGGHILPAISMARELKKRDGSRRIVFIGSNRGLERRLIPPEGFELIELDVCGITGKKLSKKVLGFLTALHSFFECLGDLRRLRPAIVIGAGGYVSGPVIISAWILRIPTMIQEQNLFPGLTNRILSMLVKEVAVSFEESRKYLYGKVTNTGNPVRNDFTSLRKKERSDKLSVLVSGGSQGSRTLNKGMVEALPLLRSFKDRLRITHQTGGAELETVRQAYIRQGVEAEVLEFITDMPKRFEHADIVISRAGASTITEITAAGKASILVPFPFAAHDHQRRNAEALLKAKAAFVCEDAEFSGAYVAETLKGFIDDPSRIGEMEKNAASLHRGGAAEKIADMAERLMAGR
ncbi:MAG: undecaprenyldiphospho-muramoylpentapeptide beta-N-acetylglucosaminyltransferase [Acidobacteriota bacterium]